MKTFFRFLLITMALASATVATIALAAPDKPLFSEKLPAAIAGKTDLWVVKFAPTKEEPTGGLYVVPRHVLGRYAEARTRGYMWVWAPLPDVLGHLDDADQPTAPTNKTLELENEALKKRIRDAVVILGVGAL